MKICLWRVNVINYVKHAKSLKKNLSNRISKAYINQKKKSNIRSDFFLGEEANSYTGHLEALTGI